MKKKGNKKLKKYIVNGITLTRVLTTIAMPFLFTALSSTMFLVLIACVLLTDFVDGFLARKWNVSTLFGSLADMGADKLLGIAILSVLSLAYPIMLLPLTLELLIGNINMNNTLKGDIGKSSQIGRIKMWVIGIGMASLLMIGATPEISGYLSNIKIDETTFKELIEKLQEILNTNNETLTKISVNVDNITQEMKETALEVVKDSIDFINNNRKTIENVAIIPPRIPPALNPAYVAIFIPIGPGVDWDIAIISAIIDFVSQVYLSANSYKNGSVANPPPIENNPILKNSKNKII